MARGLSPLQRTILQLAWQQHFQRKGSSDIYAQDLYALHYGWPITYGRWWTPEDPDKRILGQAYHFSPAHIGERTYRTVTAAVSRSFHRLARRGYLTRSSHGWSLTPAGIAVAARLPVQQFAPAFER